MKKFRVDIYEFTIRFFMDADECKSKYEFVVFEVDDNNISIVVSDAFESVYDSRFLQCLSHECNHAAMSILGRRGVNYDYQNQEALCYLQDYIFEKCYSYAISIQRKKQNKD